jgi:hypothetical protein
MAFRRSGKTPPTLCNMSNTFQNSKTVDMHALIQELEIAEDVVGGEEKKSTTVDDRRVPLKPVVNPQIMDKDVKDLVSQIRCFEIVPSLVGSNNKVLKFSYPTVSVGVTHLAWSYIRDHIPVEEQEKIFDHIDSVVSTNTTILAALVRIRDKMPSTEHFVKITDGNLDYVSEHLPVRALLELPTTIDFSRADIFDIVPSADAGMPFMATNRSAKCGDARVYKSALDLALKYIKMLDSPDAFDTSKIGNFLSYMKQRPHEFTFLLKRKFERISRTDYNTKVRSYFVVPYALKLLFKWVSYYVRQQNVGFWEDPSSASAYQFCWSSGGADKLVKWILKDSLRSIELNQIVFNAICFGDDQLWTFAMPTGEVIVCAPDYVAMDMHVASIVGKLELGRHLGGIRQQGVVPVLYKNVSALLARMAFTQNVWVNGALVVNKKFGLVSGVPLTTQFDMYASVLTHQVVKTQVMLYNVGRKPGGSPGFPPGIIEKILSRSSEMIQKLYGLTIKPETLKFQSFEFGDTMRLPFLGYILWYDEKHRAYYPIPADLNKCWSSVALPSSPLNGDKAVAVLAARIYGLLLSGYCFNATFDAYARELFSYIKKQTNSLVEPEINELILPKSEFREFIERHPFPPTIEEIKQFYLGSAYTPPKSEPPTMEVSPGPDFDLELPAVRPRIIGMAQVGQQLAAPKVAPKSTPIRTLAKRSRGKQVVSVHDKFAQLIDDYERKFDQEEGYEEEFGEEDEPAFVIHEEDESERFGGHPILEDKMLGE